LRACRPKGKRLKIENGEEASKSVSREIKKTIIFIFKKKILRYFVDIIYDLF